jgi:hypothetical protein
VAEVGAGGALTPYPNAHWNAFRNADPSGPERRFVCVQGVTFDPAGYLWVPDPAVPGFTFTIPGGPKAVRIDINGNEVVAVYPFDEKMAPQGTYLNDIRFPPDSKRAVTSNSGGPGSRSP